jgi:hypothetical protein
MASEFQDIYTNWDRVDLKFQHKHVAWGFMLGDTPTSLFEVSIRRHPGSRADAMSLLRCPNKVNTVGQLCRGIDDDEKAVTYCKSIRVDF